ncbi:MAG: hypothetical protein P4L51_04575 [Puia sp.]|nr:hypothetical protein [Puia sp.]
MIIPDCHIEADMKRPYTAVRPRLDHERGKGRYFREMHHISVFN